MAAMKECAKMITTSAGGCTTPFPFEAAIWLLEEQEELFGGTFPIQNTEVKILYVQSVHLCVDWPSTCLCLLRVQLIVASHRITQTRSQTRTHILHSLKREKLSSTAVLLLRAHPPGLITSMQDMHLLICFDI